MKILTLALLTLTMACGKSREEPEVVFTTPVSVLCTHEMAEQKCLTLFLDSNGNLEDSIELESAHFHISGLIEETTGGSTYEYRQCQFSYKLNDKEYSSFIGNYQISAVDDCAVEKGQTTATVNVFREMLRTDSTDH